MSFNDKYGKAADAIGRRAAEFAETSMPSYMPMLHVSYCGIVPMGEQCFGDVCVQHPIPRTCNEVEELREWLQLVKLPEMGRPSYGQLVLLGWHGLVG